MDNLIRRQDAIDAVETIGFDFSNCDLSQVEREELCEAIGEVRQTFVRRISNVAPAQQWIPVSERLPETTDEVLTTYIVNGNRKKRFVETATYYDGDEGYWSSPWDEYRIAGTKVEVIAWMPLPKPVRLENV